MAGGCGCDGEAGRDAGSEGWGLAGDVKDTCDINYLGYSRLEHKIVEWLWIGVCGTQGYSNNIITPLKHKVNLQSVLLIRCDWGNTYKKKKILFNRAIFDKIKICNI